MVSCFIENNDLDVVKSEQQGGFMNMDTTENNVTNSKLNEQCLMVRASQTNHGMVLTWNNIKYACKYGEQVWQAWKNDNGQA